MEQNKKTSISDLPFNELCNDFGTDGYVKGLIKFIRNSSAPITIALQGEWGSGKTSLMTRLERELCAAPESQFIGIEINTWEYSMMSSPEATVYKILAQLVQDLTRDDSNSKKTFKGFLRGAGNFIYRGARESLKTLPGVGGLLAVGLEAANIPTQLPECDDDSETASLSALKKVLSEAGKKPITEAHKRGVIIFVDDLDRLNPPVAVEILELLKNIFTLDNCIFVLAIDYDVVVKGLKPKFGELTDRNEREFRSFFDKIIQVPFSLPVNNYQPMSFILKSLVDIGYIDDFDTSDPNVTSRIAEVVEASVGKNPRSIKRLINTLSLLDCIACECSSRSNVNGC
ncbi:MAG: KAP family NTPase, partial [Muribaculaceae bacterium]|nr:KAP family NTPase [Muribaculaceae bacterium]